MCCQLTLFKQDIQLFQEFDRKLLITLPSKNSFIIILWTFAWVLCLICNCRNHSFQLLINIFIDGNKWIVELGHWDVVFYLLYDRSTYTVYSSKEDLRAADFPLHFMGICRLWHFALKQKYSNCFSIIFSGNWNEDTVWLAKHYLAVTFQPVCFAKIGTDVSLNIMNMFCFNEEIIEALPKKLSLVDLIKMQITNCSFKSKNFLYVFIECQKTEKGTYVTNQKIGSKIYCNKNEVNEECLIPPKTNHTQKLFEHSWPNFCDVWLSV